MDTNNKPDWKNIYRALDTQVIILDREHRVVYANKAFREEMKKTGGELTGKKCYEMFHNSNKPPAGCPLESLLLSEKVESEEMYIEALGKTWFVTCTPILDGNESADYVAHTMIDVSEHKKAEEALRRSEERYKTITELATDYMFKVDIGRDGRIVLSEVSDNYNAITGRKLEEVKSVDSWTSIFHPDDLSTAMSFMKKVIESGEQGSFECRTLLADGKERWINIFAKPVIDSKTNRIVSVIGAIKDISDRKIAEEARQKSEDRYKAILDFSPDAITIIDLNGQIVECSSATATLHGYESRDELVGTSVFNLVAPEDLNIAANEIKALINQKNVKGFQYRCLRKDGSTFPVETSASIINNNAGDPVYFIGITKDITERKKNEEDLRANEHFLNSIVDNIPNMIFVKSADDLRFVSINRTGLEFVDNADHIGKTAYDLFTKEEADFFTAKDREVLETGRMADIEEETIHTAKNGVKLLRTKKIPIMDKTGKPVYLLGISEDITELKKAESEIRRLGTAVQQTIDGIAIADMDGMIIFANKAWANMHGYERGEELIGKHLSIFHTEEQMRSDVIPFNEKVIGLGACYGNVGHFRKDGTTFPTYMTTTVLKDKDGKPTGLVGIARDITEWKKNAEEKELLQQQLLQSQKMEAVGQLAGGIAHDFNNIVATIIGNTELALRKMNEDDPNRVRLNRIIKSSKRARDLVQKLLSFSRKEKLDIQSVSINSIMNEIRDILEVSVLKSVRIVTDFDDSIPNLSVDATQITQAILNICLNACDAMEENGVLILESRAVHFERQHVSTIVRIPPGDYCAVTISDNGTGIPEHMLPRIFEPFFTTKDKGQGTGLGLSIAGGIIRSHNGYIDVKSKPGNGTTVTAYLPVGKNDEETGDTAERREDPAARTGTILVIDDDEDYLQMIEEALKSDGHRILKAPNGYKAKEIFEKHSATVDLVLLDMIMPEMDGVRTFDEIKKLSPETKVFICSGYSVEGKASELLKKGAVEFIQKPFQLSKLSGMIFRALSSN